MLRWVSPDLENPPPSWGCLRGALEPTMWFLGPVAEFRNQAFLFSYLCLNSRKFRKRLGVIDLTFHCCSFNIEGSLLGGQRPPNNGDAAGAVPQQGKDSSCAGCRRSHLSPRAPNQPGEGRPQRAPHSGAQGTPRRGSRPPLDGERIGLWGRGGPRLPKGRLAATRNSPPRLSPGTQVGTQCCGGHA